MVTNCNYFRMVSMITTSRSACPINRALEMVGDQWSLLILHDIVLRLRLLQTLFVKTKNIF